MSELNNIIESMNDVETYRNPFLHFTGKNFFSEDYYSQLLENLPTENFWHTTSIKMGSVGLRKVFWPGPWSEEPFYEYENDFLKSHVKMMHSVEFMDTIITLLKIKKDNYYSQMFFSWDTTGYAIFPHPDTPHKIATIQFPLCEDNKYAEDSGMHLLIREDGIYTKVKKLTFEKNKIFGFKVTKNSFHSVEHIKNPKRRQMILNIYRVSELMSPRYERLYRL